MTSSVWSNEDSQLATSFGIADKEFSEIRYYTEKGFNGPFNFSSFVRQSQDLNNNNPIFVYNMQMQHNNVQQLNHVVGMHLKTNEVIKPEDYHYWYEEYRRYEQKHSPPCHQSHPGGIMESNFEFSPSEQSGTHFHMANTAYQVVNTAAPPAHMISSPLEHVMEAAHALESPVLCASDSDSSHASVPWSVPARGRQPKKDRPNKGTRNLNTAKLWELLLWLLLNQNKYGHIIKWESQGSGIFHISDSDLLEQVYNNYKQFTKKGANKQIKLGSITRALRHYYEDGVIKPVNKKYKYMFGPNAQEWHRGVTRQNAVKSIEEWEKSPLGAMF
ncbi:ecdysone-induced protein 74EF-like isoform X2 [Symsagittifera roscoffensis]|uniref:ecdysone-induced protein 74EF-like isoform X2 n=1 Tax=Symsagittifera roscoffensis TaxID=84072 RepID=UPI00307C7B35